MSKQVVFVTMLKLINLSASIIMIVLFITLQNFYDIKLTDLSKFALIIFIIQVIQFRILNFKIYDFRLWFIILLNLFLLGRLYINLFNQNYFFFWLDFSDFDYNLVIRSSVYSIVSIQVFFTSFLFTSKESNILKLSAKNDNKTKAHTLVLVAFIMFAVSFPFRLYIDIRNIIAVQSTGSFLSVQTWDGFSNILSIFFVPSIIFFVVNSNKMKKEIVLITIVYFLIVMILTGDRRYQTTSILSIGLSYLAIYNKKIRLKEVLLIFVMIYFGLMTLATIRNIRFDSLQLFSTFASELFNSRNVLNVFYETLSEFGLSLFSVVQLMKYIPNSYSFLNGLSFYGSIPSLFPTGWFLSDFYKKVSISNFINTLPGERPFGATIIGDFYANFGNMAFIFIFFFGIFLSKIFTLPKRTSRYYQYNLSIYFSLFYILINLVRSSFFEIFRSAVYIYLFPLIILFFIKETKLGDSYQLKSTL